MTNTVQLSDKQKEQRAIAAVKERFVRVPSMNTFPRFRDLVTNIDQADAGIIEHFYRANGGEDYEAPYLLACLHYMYGEGFLPNGPSMLPGGLVNMWQRPEVQYSGNNVTADDVPLFIEFLNRWFPNRQDRKYFTWWLAHAVRRPEQRIIATLLLRSEPSTGKGFFAECMMPGLLGKKAAVLTSLRDVVGDFNDVIEGKTFILIDEVYRSKKSTTDHLKSIQGNATLSLRRKHKPVVAIDNFINFVVTSNDHIPLVLEHDDRRFWVPPFLKHHVDIRETQSFLNDELKPWLLSGGFQLVRDYLETVDLNTFQATGTPPMTEDKKTLMGLSTAGQLDELLGDYCDNVPVTTVQITRAKFSENFDRDVSDLSIVNGLLAAGCEMKRSKVAKFYITRAGKAKGLGAHTKPSELEKLLSFAA